MATPRKANVLAADLEPVSRCGLVHLVNAHDRLRICAEAETTAQVRELCAQWKPDVLILDPSTGDGFALIKDLPRWSDRTRVVVLTALEDADAVQRAFKAGACGYVTRRDPISALLAAIVGAVDGERHVGPRVEHLLLEKLAGGEIEVRENEVATLSNRELEIFRLIGAGRGTRAVAEELHVSVKTVETHRQRIKDKLHLRDGCELQKRAVLFHHAAAA